MTFKESLRAEGGRTKHCYRAASYLARGVYVDQVARFFRLFGRKQVLCIRSKDLFVTPVKILNNIFRFVGAKTFIPSAEQLKTNRHKGRYSRPMAERVRAELLDFFGEPNRLLYELLDRDMGWDK